MSTSMNPSESNPAVEYDMVIIGGGPTGASAALYAARADLKTLVIDKGLMAGALGATSRIANYPGIPEISGAELVERMRAQAEAFGAVFVQDKVQGLELTETPKVVYGNNGTYQAKAVLIATGSMGRGQRVPGEERLLGVGSRTALPVTRPSFAARRWRWPATATKRWKKPCFSPALRARFICSRPNQN